MDLKVISENEFANVAAMNAKIYDAKDRLANARTLTEKLKVKKEIQQLIDARDALVKSL